VTGVVVAAALAVFPFGTAAKAATPAASAFGASVQVGGQDVVPPTPAVSVATPPGDATDTVVDLPAAPVIVNGTLTATANAHPTANIASGLTVVPQAIAGPYNGRGLAQIESADVVYDVAGAGVALLSAATIRSEAAVICGATPRYTANSEVIDLAVGGTDIPLNAPVQDLIDAISGALTDSGLSAVADVQRNVVTQLPGGGIGVDALVVTVLAAAGDTPLAQVRLAHAEVSAAACNPVTQCSDGADNDGDAKIDTADPGCHSDANAANAASYVPSDNDETNTQCSDAKDNDGDAKIDADDPGCHKGNSLASPYDPSDNDESNAAEVSRAALPRTGGEADMALTGAGLATLAGLGLRLRRRIAG
jgi:LPXTG-motif cell wall-anchored protein